MDVILYNPLSRNGKNNKLVLKLSRRLRKKGHTVEIKSLLEISNIEEYLKSVNPKARFIIVGGDGTLNHLANSIKDYDVKQEIYLFKGGTGNDFARSIKAKKKLVPIKKYLYNLPKISFNNKEYLFLNGVGLGIDGYVGHKLNEAAASKSRSNYLTITLSSFRTFNPGASVVTVDGKVIKIKKTWLVSVMNSQYFGGGMKIAPFANRNDETLQVVIVKGLSRLKLILLFPLIYRGWHRFIKKYVEIIEAKEVSVKFDEPNYMQVDGETFDNINEIKVKTANL